MKVEISKKVDTGGISQTIGAGGEFGNYQNQQSTRSGSNSDITMLVKAINDLITELRQK